MDLNSSKSPCRDCYRESLDKDECLLKCERLRVWRAEQGLDELQRPQAWKTVPPFGWKINDGGEEGSAMDQELFDELQKGFSALEDNVLGLKKEIKKIEGTARQWQPLFVDLKKIKQRLEQIEDLNLGADIFKHIDKKIVDQTRLVAETYPANWSNIKEGLEHLQRVMEIHTHNRDGKPVIETDISFRSSKSGGT